MHQQSDSSGPTVSPGAAVLVATLVLVGVATVGAGVTAGQTSSAGPAVETGWADAVSDTESIFEANVTSLGGAEEVRVWIEYREDGASTWQESQNTTVTQTGSVTFVVGDLGRTTAYEYRAVVATTDGQAFDTGEVRTYTPYQIHPSISIDEPADVGATSATLSATLYGTADADYANVSFEYRAADSETWQETASERFDAAASVTRTVTGLSPNTTYEYRASAVDAHGDEGTSDTASFTTAPGLAVRTGWAERLGESKASVGANLTSLGGANAATVRVQYREANTSTWQDSASETVNQTGLVRLVVDGLARTTTYEYRAVATAADGSQETAGDVKTFTTPAVAPWISVDPPAAVGESTATLNATLEDMGGGESVDVWFSYRVEGTDTWQHTGNQTLTAPGSVTQAVDGLSPGTTYEYRANAGDDDGDSGHSWHTETVTTDATVAVETRKPWGVGETNATLSGAVTDFGGPGSPDVGFEYREAGTSTWTPVDATVTSDGSFSTEVTGLSPNTTYEFRAVGIASDGTTDTGTVVTFVTETAPGVRTGAVTAVDETTATVTAEVTALGGADKGDVAVAYRPVGASTWSETAGQTVNGSTTVAFDLTGLEPGTDYEYRAELSAFDGDRDTGAIESFATDSRPAVSTGDATDVGATSATVSADLTDLGGASSADVAVEYRPVGASTWQATAGRTLTTPGTVSTTLTELSPGTDYEYRATATAADSDTATGAVRTFGTDTLASPPSVDRLDAREDSPPNPHAEVSVDWRVSDADGDLSSVTVRVSDARGSTVASEQVGTSGGSASGSLYEKIKHGAGDTYTVTVTATDAGGRTTTHRTTLPT